MRKGNLRVISYNFPLLILVIMIFDYKTLYAHMHTFAVKKGQILTRAEIIGTVGSTGKSTGPHLHYEVIYKNQKVDPLNYYFLDLSPEEYDTMIQLATNAGNVID